MSQAGSSHPQILFLSSLNSPSGSLDMNLLMEGVLTLPVKIIADKAMIDLFKKIKTPNKRAEIMEEKSNIIADMIIITGDISDKKDLSKLINRGSVPVLSLKNAKKYNFTEFNPLEEKGDSFIFEEYNHWDVFSAIVKACETYEFPYDWKNIAKASKDKTL